VNTAVYQQPVMTDSDKLELVLYPNPILKRRCEESTDFGPKLRAIADQMLALMHEHQGIGLAAPQVGLSIRMFVCCVDQKPESNMVFVNPHFVELTGSTEAEEGCLSLPGIHVTLRRASRAVIRALDVEGRPFEVTGEDLLARVWQHETDHLDGRLIIDTMSVSDEIANRRAIRQLKSGVGNERR